MKKTPTNQIARVALVMLLLAEVSGTVIAGGPAIPTNQVPTVIDLHAPNNATPVVTVWIPQPSSGTAKTCTAGTQRTARVIELPASNGGSRSITVWIHDCKCGEHPLMHSSP
jgi:hypothetical protein